MAEQKSNCNCSFCSLITLLLTLLLRKLNFLKLFATNNYYRVFKCTLHHLSKIYLLKGKNKPAIAIIFCHQIEANYNLEQMSLKNVVTLRKFAAPSQSQWPRASRLLQPLFYNLPVMSLLRIKNCRISCRNATSDLFIWICI